jgi:cytochrome b561
MRRPITFNLLARVLHWTMAVLVIAMLYIGIGMVSTVSPRYHALLTLHKSIGILILGLVVIRLVNRLLRPPPALPTDLPAWQTIAAEASHILLYGLMFALPLVGWGMLSAGGYPIVVFGGLQLPHILPHDAHLFANLRQAHTVLALSLFLVFLVHLGAGLFHGLIRRDKVLPSMTTGA